MGRYSTGAQTCESSLRIELSYLQKNGFLKKGNIMYGSLSWSSRGEPSGNISFICSNREEKYVRLIYTFTDHQDGQKHEYDYKIFLDSVPSNLGKGEILYFLCPVTGKRCRVLYKAYGYPKWKSREAYQNRLYYSSQTSSKMDYANDRFWTLERKIERIEEEKHFHFQHNGRPTRKAAYLKKLKEERNEWDGKRWEPENMPKSLRKLIF